MSDLGHLLLTNLTEAMRQVQQYIVLALGTSVSAAALTFAPSSPNEKPGSIILPGTFVAIDYRIALVFLLAISGLAGAMAYFSAETANGTAHLISSRTGTAAPDLLLAASTFPGIATSPHAAVRYIAVLLPLVFSLIALLRTALKERPVAWDAVRGWLIFLAVCYLPLAIELRHPVGAS